MVKSGCIRLNVIESDPKWFYVVTSGCMCIYIPHTSLHPWQGISEIDI